MSSFIMHYESGSARRPRGQPLGPRSRWSLPGLPLMAIGRRDVRVMSPIKAILVRPA
jgi:hypothetical protein